MSSVLVDLDSIQNEHANTSNGCLDPNRDCVDEMKLWLLVSNIQHFHIKYPLQHQLLTNLAKKDTKKLQSNDNFFQHFL